MIVIINHNLSSTNIHSIIQELKPKLQLLQLSLSQGGTLISGDSHDSHSRARVFLHTVLLFKNSKCKLWWQNLRIPKVFHYFCDILVWSLMTTTIGCGNYAINPNT